MKSSSVYHLAAIWSLTSNAGIHASPVTKSERATGAQNYTFDQIPSTAQLKWYPCYQTYQCARLTVPLDYNNPQLANASVPLIKLSAQKSSNFGAYKGAILVNPGGPGLSGIDTILTIGSQIQQNITGTNYDLIGFDPRGVARSIPSATCAPADLSSKHKRSDTTFKTPVLAPELIPQFYMFGEQLGAVCEAKIGAENQAGPHMSTAVVARDMLAIIDAISGCSRAKTLLNYYGLSYGTFLGETFASMYPDRVGRMVLDGVVDPEDYASGTGLREVLLMDDTFATFFQDCYRAGPKLCTFYTGNSALDIQNRAEAIFAQLDPTAAAMAGKDITVYITALRTLKSFLSNASYQPRLFWPYVAQQFLAYENVLKNNSLSLDSVQTISTITPSVPSSPIDWTLAVTCSEIPLYGKNLTQEYLATLTNQSTLGVDYFGTIAALCTRWPIRADWVYTGPFGAKTKNGRLLFVSNTLDPITPIINSQTWYRKFSGAQFLSTDGAGHTSLSNPNSCTWSNIMTFFQKGQMDSQVKHCNQEAKYLPFTGISSNF